MDQSIRDAARVISSRLEAEARKRVGDRQALEARWIEDLRQYHGRYDEQTERRLDENKDRSKLFMNRTRRKTRAMAARLKEMLFPTDDENWDVDPTPVPEIEAMAEQADAMDDGETKSRLDDIRQEARRRSDAMRREMQDQLVECRYEAACRDVIDDACKIGLGVIKGPVRSSRRKRMWERGEEGYQIKRDDRPKPEFRRVDPWSWFPDTNARTIEESEGFFERHLLNKKGLRKLAKQPGFDVDAIRRLIEQGPQNAAPEYLTNLRNISGDQQHIGTDTFHVWEYSGPLEADDMRALAAASGDMDALADLGEVDPLQETQAIVWFCGNEVLRFGLYPLDSDEPLYSVFTLEPDEGTIFGKGIPALMRDSQRSLGAAWRAMLDNGGFAKGPQIVINDEYIEPVDGDWTLTGPKLWRLKKPIPAGVRVFDQFQITMNQEQLAGIIALSERFIDEETGLPQIAMGEQTEQTTKTMGGMALLMSQGNHTFREIVKRFDDDFTVPNIQRLFDWNMQFNDKEEIKGDCRIRARGVSVLLVREIEAINTFFLYQVLGPNDPDVKADELKRAMIRALALSTHDMMRSEDEKAAWLEEQQQGPSDADMKAKELEVREMEIEAKTAIAEMEADSRLKTAKMKYDADMFGLAEKLNMDAEKLSSIMKQHREQADSRERIVAVEAAMKQQTGDSAGGFV